METMMMMMMMIMMIDDDDAQAGAVFIFQGEQFSLVYMLLNSWCLIWTIYGRHSRSPICSTYTSIYLTIPPST